MADQKTLEIILKGKDDGVSAMFDKVGTKANTLAQQLRSGGDIGELGAVKKFGKNLGEFVGLDDTKQSIRGNADEMRLQAAVNLRDEYGRINAELATGNATELRTAKLIDMKLKSAEAYKRQIMEINKAESTALKSGGGGVARGVAVAGGILLAVKAAGELAKAYDLANQKLEKGEITSGMFWAEWAKGVPIIGGVVQSAEQLMMVVTGTAKALREANAEAAELDKKIGGQNKDRKTVDDIVAGVAGINDTDTQRINREANKKLKEIADARAAGEASGVVNKGNDRDIALRKAEEEIIKKREKDLGEVEARERDKRRKQVEAVDDRIAAGNAEVMDQRVRDEIDALEANGKKLEAAELKIRADADAKRRELAKERQKLAGETGLTDQQRIALGNGIDARRGAIDAAERNALDVARAEERRRVTDTIGAANQDAISTAEEKRREQLDLARTSLSSQQSARTSILDARGQTGFQQQMREFITPTTENTNATKDNTKSMEKLKTSIENLIQNAGQSFTFGGGALIG